MVMSPCRDDRAVPHQDRASQAGSATTTPRGGGPAASRDLSPGTTESWRVVAKFCHGDRPSLGPRSVPGTDRVVAKVYAQGALYEAGGVNHEIHRELVVDSSSRVVATRRSLLLLIRRSDYWIAHVVRRLIRIFKNTCEPVRHLLDTFAGSLDRGQQSPNLHAGCVVPMTEQPV